MIAALRAFRAHVRRLWPRRALLPLLPFGLYALVCAVFLELRVMHVAAVLLVAVLAYTGPRSKALLGAVYPVGLVGLLYDGMRPIRNLGLSPERVLLCDLRGLELRLFGFEIDGMPMTMHDWFLVHHWPAIDLLAAFPYATFILASIACAVFLALRDPLAMRRFTWAFFAANVAGFVTYRLLPAAPPWYFHGHGCTVDLATHASAGPALTRVDAMLGVPYFHGMYAQASTVFGALPSLHCAYPLLVVLAGWRSFGPALRVLSVAYWLLMIFASVYLDHHWLVDGLLGSTYALLAWLLLRRLLPSPSEGVARVRAPSARPVEVE